jgi:cell division protein FtsL
MATDTPFTRDSEGKIILKEIPESGSLEKYSNISMKELIEERLGYSFKLEEIPPKLRAKLVKLENDWPDLIEKNSSYHKFEEELLRQLPQQRREREVETNIREVETKIKGIDHELENPRPIGCLGVVSVVLGIVFLLFGIIGLGEPIETSGSIILFVLAAILIIPVVIVDSNGSRREKYKEHLLEEKQLLLEEKQLLNGEYERLEKEQEIALKPYKKEIIPIMNNFNNDFISLSNGIDNSLNAIFQGKMDFGLLRSTMKTKGIIIEKIQCPYCGADITLPETGHVVKCEHCGRNVYAADILKELEKR